MSRGTETSGMNGDGTDGDDDGRTSEYVPPPGFGETGPPAPPTESMASSTVAVPPSYFSNDVTSQSGVAPPDQSAFPVPVVAGRGGSSSNGPIMAVLAVALLVIVGGTAALIATNLGSLGSDDDAAGVPAVDMPAESIDPVETRAPLTQPPGIDASVSVPPASVAPETVAPGTVPPETVPAPPTPSPVAAIDPETGRGFGDLGLGQPVLAEPCTDTYVTFVFGVAGGDTPYPEQIQRGLDAFPGSNYIWGGMCPSLRQFNDNGDEIYGVVYGPVGSAQEACEIERQFASAGAYVRRLNTIDPVGREDHCS